MYKISKIAALFGISVKTLYVYEKHNLLPPAWVDPANGYRWYDNSSVLLLSLIIKLKDSGLTLREIHAHLSGELTVQKQLEELCARKEAIERSIALLSGLAVPEGVHPVMWGRFDRRCCLTRTLVARDIEEIFSVHDALLSKAIQDGFALDRRYSSFCRFHGGEFRTTHIPVTVHLNIQAEGAPQDAVAVPEESVILTRHKGSYESIGAAYDALFAYVSEHRLTVTGDPIENYVESYGADDQGKFVTEVLLPVDDRRKENKSGDSMVFSPI